MKMHYYSDAITHLLYHIMYFSFFLTKLGGISKKHLEIASHAITYSTLY